MGTPYLLPEGSDVQPGLDAPAAGAFAVTPDDDTDLAKPARSLFVGTGGDVAVVMLSGDEVTFTNVPDGTLLPIRVTRVKEVADTGASDIIALY